MLELKIRKTRVEFKQKSPKAVYLEVRAVNGDNGRKVKSNLRLKVALVARVDIDVNFMFWVHINS